MIVFRRLALVVLFLVLLALAGAAWYIFGGNGQPAAELVPGDTLLFALVPNGASIGTGYSTSRLRQLLDAPEAQPLFDEINSLLGAKNLALLRVLGPDLSGQSFLALTHLDPAHPLETGFIAAMRPKLGTDHFDEFVQQLNAAYPDLAKETKTGHDTLLGLDYQWIQGANAPGRICVARYHGWIVTTWGEASLQDFLERMQGRSATPSLADNADYQKSRTRIGAGAQAVLYASPHTFDLLLRQSPRMTPAMLAQFRQSLGSLGGLAVGSSFENTEIVDRFSVLEPKQAQLDSGMARTPCAFDTLKFTGPDTRFYFGANIDWPRMWSRMQEQFNATQPAAQGVLNQLTSLAQAEGIDVQKNIIDALGQEYSLQLEWADGAPYPDVAIYVKVDKPDDFKPAVAALIDESRKTFANSAVITEMESDGHHFATLKMVNPMPVSPTIIEDGPYFGFFLNETHAVRSLARDESRGLLHNDDFNRQLGSQRDGATQLMFLDTPRLLDQAYRTGLPYLSMGAMFNPQLGAFLQNHKLPSDLAWLAPVGTWATASHCDDDGITAYSVSGVGNQGIAIAGGAAATAILLQQAGVFGMLPHPALAPANASAPIAAPVPPPPPAPPVPQNAPAPPQPPSTH
jgi:hypothetical protein